jgi:hypothetical protein
MSALLERVGVERVGVERVGVIVSCLGSIGCKYNTLFPFRSALRIIVYE